MKVLLQYLEGHVSKAGAISHLKRKPLAKLWCLSGMSMQVLKIWSPVPQLRLCACSVSFCSHWAEWAPQSHCQYKPAQRCTKCQTPAPQVDTWQSPMWFCGRDLTAPGPRQQWQQLLLHTPAVPGHFQQQTEGKVSATAVQCNTPCYQTQILPPSLIYCELARAEESLLLDNILVLFIFRMLGIPV